MDEHADVAAGEDARAPVPGVISVGGIGVYGLLSPSLSSKGGEGEGLYQGGQTPR